MVTGLFVVPIALLFRSTDRVYEKERQVYPSRMVVHLPRWAWIWDNDTEGAMSWMKRWPDLIWFGKKPESLWAMYQWLAIRNPSNNLKYVRGLAVQMQEVKEILLIAGTAKQVSPKYNLKGFQFFTAKSKYFRYFNLHYVGKWIWIRFGHKIEPRHWLNDIEKGKPEKVSEIDLTEKLTTRKLWKGMTFRFGLMSKYK